MKSEAPSETGVPEARPAATVMLFDHEMRVLLVQRSRDIKFFGGAFAFPGGRVEASDAPERARGGDPWQTHALPPAGLSVPLDRSRLFAAYENAVRRELAEECAVTLPSDAPLLPWARWVTPEQEPKRFDTLFFVAQIAEVTVRVDASETVAFRWLRPAEALALAGKGELVLPPPTFVTLAEIAAYSDWAALARAATATPLPEIFPRVLAVGDALYLALPGDPAHPTAMPRPWPVGLPTRARIEQTERGLRAQFQLPGATP